MGRHLNVKQEYFIAINPSIESASRIFFNKVLARSCKFAARSNSIYLRFREAIRQPKQSNRTTILTNAKIIIPRPREFLRAPSIRAKHEISYYNCIMQSEVLVTISLSISYTLQLNHITNSKGESPASRYILKCVFADYLASTFRKCIAQGWELGVQLWRSVQMLQKSH